MTSALGDAKRIKITPPCLRCSVITQGGQEEEVGVLGKPNLSHLMEVIGCKTAPKIGGLRTTGEANRWEGQVTEPPGYGRTPPGRTILKESRMGKTYLRE